MTDTHESLGAVVARVMALGGLVDPDQCFACWHLLEQHTEDGCRHWREVLDRTIVMVPCGCQLPPDVASAAPVLAEALERAMGVLAKVPGVKLDPTDPELVEFTLAAERVFGVRSWRLEARALLVEWREEQG